MATNQFGKNINLTIQASDLTNQSMQNKTTEETAEKIKKMYAQQFQTLATSFNVHVHRLNTSISNLLGKTELLSGTPEIYKVVRSFKQFTAPAYKGVIEKALGPYIPAIQQKIPLYEAAADIISRLKGIDTATAKNIFGRDLFLPQGDIRWHTTLTKKQIEYIQKNEEAKQALEKTIGRKVSPEILEEMAVMFGEGSKISTARDVFDKTAKALKRFNSKIELATKSFEDLQKNLEKASKVPFFAQFKYGFSQPFKKLASTFGIPTGMGIGTAIGGFVGTASTAAILGGIYLASRTVKQGFDRYRETAPFKTQIQMRELLAGNQLPVYSNLNRYSANMALFGVREPQALEQLRNVLFSLPSTYVERSPLQRFQDILFGLTRQFKIRGINQELAPQLLSVLASVGALEKDIRFFDKTPGGSKLLKILDNTRLIGYRQTDFLKSLIETVQANPLAFAGTKQFTGLVNLSERLLQTGIPALQGIAPKVAAQLYQGVASFGGKFAPLIWANAPGKTMWERFKAVQSPEFTGQILDRLSKALNLNTESGKLLFASLLKQFGISGNVAVQLTELWNKQVTKGLTPEEQKRKEELLQQAYTKTPEGLLNQLVATSEEILRTLEGSIAANVIKITAAVTGTLTKSQRQAYREALSHALIEDWHRQRQAIIARGKAEGKTSEEIQKDIEIAKKKYESEWGISLSEAEKIEKRRLKAEAQSYGISKTRFGYTIHEKSALTWLKNLSPADKEIATKIGIPLAQINYEGPRDIQSLIKSYSSNIYNLLSSEKERLKQEEKQILSKYGSNPVVLPKILEEYRQKEQALREYITEFNKIKANVNTADKLAELMKLFNELKQHISPQKPKGKPTAENNINITINIDNNTASNTRVVSSGDMYASISEAILNGLKEALNRAGLYDIVPPLGYFKGVAQG